MQCTLLRNVIDAKNVIGIQEKQVFPESRCSLASLVPEGEHLGSELGVGLSDSAWLAGVRIAQFLPFEGLLLNLGM